MFIALDLKQMHHEMIVLSNVRASALTARSTERFHNATTLCAHKYVKIAINNDRLKYFT